MNVLLQGGPTASATLIGQFGAIGMVHVQVLTASATVRIGLSKQELEYSQNLPATQIVGLQVAAETPPEIVSLWWAVTGRSLGGAEVGCCPPMCSPA